MFAWKNMLMDDSMFFFLFAFMQIIFVALIPHYLNQILHMLSKSAGLIATRSKINTTAKQAASFSSFRFTSCFIQLLDQYYQYLFMCKLKIVPFFCYSMLFISLFTMHAYSNFTMTVEEFTIHAISNIF